MIINRTTRLGFHHRGDEVPPPEGRSQAADDLNIAKNQAEATHRPAQSHAGYWGSGTQSNQVL